MNSKIFGLSLFFSIIIAELSQAQEIDYGLIIIYNSSTQTNTDPTIPEDGRFQWNYLGTWGAGIFAEKDLSQKFVSHLSLHFQQKGYKEIAQVGFIGGPFNEETLENTFNYICADISMGYHLFHSKSLVTSLTIGLEYGYLLDYEIESDFFPINNFYPVNAYQDKWEKSNFSILPSVSFAFEHGTTFTFGFNRSLSPVLETDNLIVKDWIWTFRLSQSIPALFRKTDE